VRIAGPQLVRDDGCYFDLNRRIDDLQRRLEYRDVVYPGQGSRRWLP
jgi:hypothetical protein